jgi:hypothetical protein
MVGRVPDGRKIREKDSMKDSSGYLGRETPKDFETEKKFAKRYRVGKGACAIRFNDVRTVVSALA